MRTSESIAKISPALLSAQKAIGAVLKSADNPYFKSKYADLSAVIEAVKEPLNTAGIVFMQAVGTENGTAYVETMLLHESGEFMATQTPVFSLKEKDPQAFGSGVTYSKRYALQALLGLPTEDDDGNHAADKDTNGKKPKTLEAKPEIDLAALKSDKGVAYIRKFKDASAAMAELAKTKTVTLPAEAFIKEVFETQAVAQ